MIYYHTDRKLELYNIEEDISESQDLSATHPEKAAELAQILTEHLKQTDAGMPVDKVTGRGVEYPAEMINQSR